MVQHRVRGTDLNDSDSSLCLSLPLPTSANDYTINNLRADTQYEIRLLGQLNCGLYVFSNWDDARSHSQRSAFDMIIDILYKTLQDFALAVSVYLLIPAVSHVVKLYCDKLKLEGAVSHTNLFPLKLDAIIRTGRQEVNQLFPEGTNLLE